MTNCSEKCRTNEKYGKHLDKLIEKFPICKPGQEATCFNEVWVGLEDSYVESLSKPCTTIKYTGTSSAQINDGGGINEGGRKAIFGYRFSTPPVFEVHEEYLILDPVGLISSVGGTLGICIGASIYDFLKLCLSHAVQYIVKKTQKQSRKSGRK